MLCTKRDEILLEDKFVRRGIRNMKILIAIHNNVGVASLE